MFVPYFLFSNVKFNVTVPPIYYQEILGFRDKALSELPNHILLPHKNHSS